MTYASKALRTYLLRYIGFPEGRDERRQIGISPKVKELPKDLQDEFLKFFIGAAAFFDWNQGLLRFSDVSRHIVDDIEAMVRARVTKDSISVREGAIEDRFVLSASTIPSMELYHLGFLSANERIKRQAGVYWSERVGSRAYGYIRRMYPHLVDS
jgi:hypothetical protein